MELDEANVVPADVTKFVLDEKLRAFAVDHFRDYTADWSPLERIELRNRLASAIHSPEVNLILRPPRPGLK